MFSANEDPITAAMEFLTLQNMHFRAPAIESINQGFDGGDGCGIGGHRDVEAMAERIAGAVRLAVRGARAAARCGI